MYRQIWKSSLHRHLTTCYAQKLSKGQLKSVIQVEQLAADFSGAFAAYCFFFSDTKQKAL